jgi:hypothetical protein
MTFASALEVDCFVAPFPPVALPLAMDFWLGDGIGVSGREFVVELAADCLALMLALLLIAGLALELASSQSPSSTALPGVLSPISKCTLAGRFFPSVPSEDVGRRLLTVSLSWTSALDRLRFKFFSPVWELFLRTRLLLELFLSRGNLCKDLLLETRPWACPCLWPTTCFCPPFVLCCVAGGVPAGESVCWVVTEDVER